VVFWLFSLCPVVRNHAMKAKVPQQAFPQILEFSQLLMTADLSCATGCSLSSPSKLSREPFLALHLPGSMFPEGGRVMYAESFDCPFWAVAGIC
jgi:hypothetical protein